MEISLWTLCFVENTTPFRQDKLNSVCNEDKESLNICVQFTGPHCAQKYILTINIFLFDTNKCLTSDVWLTLGTDQPSNESARVVLADCQCAHSGLAQPPPGTETSALLGPGAAPGELVHPETGSLQDNRHEDLAAEVLDKLEVLQAWRSRPAHDRGGGGGQLPAGVMFCDFDRAQPENRK